MVKVFIGLILLLSHGLLYLKGINDGTLSANARINMLVPKSQEVKNQEFRDIAQSSQIHVENSGTVVIPIEHSEPNVNVEQSSVADREIAGETNETEDEGNDRNYFQEGRPPKYEEDITGGE
jgi:hypothetical protein